MKKISLHFKNASDTQAALPSKQYQLPLYIQLLSPTSQDLQSIPLQNCESMDDHRRLKLHIFSLIILARVSGHVEAHWKTLNIVNKCTTPIWPGLAPNAGYPVPAGGGFLVRPGRYAKVVVPWTWQGRVWGRTGCTFSETGTGTCVTGDCDGKFQCNGSIGKPPATLAQFTFQPDGKLSYYDVSLVDGFNLPLAVKGDGCSVAGCGADINRMCPTELQVRDAWGSVVACKSACLAFDLDRFCCRGAFSSSSTCSPSVYSKMFKNACPNAYSYAFDTPPPLFTCSADVYTLTFCPPKKSSLPPSLYVGSF